MADECRITGREILTEGTNGEKLKVLYKGDGNLSLSVVIHRCSYFPLRFVSFVLCLLPVSIALCKDFFLFSYFPFWGTLAVATVFVAIGINIFSNFSRESVLVIKDLGVQYTKSGPYGMQTTQFIDQHKIVDVLINEAITMHQVVFYLTLLTRNQAKDGNGSNQELVPLFTATMPRLETLKPIYYGMRQILCKGNSIDQ